MVRSTDQIRGVSRFAGDVPTATDMEALFRQKYGDPAVTGWAPRRRRASGYYLPADVYEALVAGRVTQGSTWLDIGGGHAIFPDNPKLATELAARCSRLVVVDPSDNVTRNVLAHEVAQCLFEQYECSGTFDMATMRMVVEHVERPEEFVQALARAIRPDGVVVVFTVNRRSLVTLLSRIVPFRFHHAVKRLFWGGEEEDTFPAHYRMNRRQVLADLFGEAGFVEQSFMAVDDLSVFAAYRWLNAAELALWRALRAVGLSYPENCLIGVYAKSGRATG